MSEWHEVQLGGVATFRKGINYTSSDYSDEDSGRPFMTIKCFVKGGGYEAKGLKYIRGSFRKEDRLSAGDLIFSVTDLTRAGDIVGSPLQVPFFGEDAYAVASMDCMRIEPVDSVCNKDFLYQRMMLSDIRRQMVAYSAGSTVLHLDTKQVPRISARFPVDPKIQQKIAHILQTIDRAIEHTEALIDKYQQIKAGLMHDLFTRGIGPNGQLRPPRDQAPELYQQTSIGWIPKEWSCLPLKNMARAGITHLRTGPFGTSLKGEHWVVEGTPVITIGALGEGGFDSNELLFIGDLDAQRLADFQMKLGDIVFSRVADVGRSVVIEEMQVGWIMSSNLMRISLDKEFVAPHFLQNQLSFDSRVKKQIRTKVNSGGRDVANSEVLNSLLFVWPDINEQGRILMRANTLNTRILTERKYLEKFQKQKSGLMHDLLTGKVPVTVDAAAPEAAHD